MLIHVMERCIDGFYSLSLGVFTQESSKLKDLWQRESPKQWFCLKIYFHEPQGLNVRRLLFYVVWANSIIMYICQLITFNNNEQSRAQSSWVTSEGGKIKTLSSWLIDFMWTTTLIKHFYPDSNYTAIYTLTLQPGMLMNSATSPR